MCMETFICDKKCSKVKIISSIWWVKAWMVGNNRLYKLLKGDGQPHLGHCYPRCICA